MRHSSRPWPVPVRPDLTATQSMQHRHYHHSLAHLHRISWFSPTTHLSLLNLYLSVHHERTAHHRQAPALGSTSLCWSASCPSPLLLVRRRTPQIRCCGAHCSPANLACWIHALLQCRGREECLLHADNPPAAPEVRQDPRSVWRGDHCRTGICPISGYTYVPFRVVDRARANVIQRLATMLWMSSQKRRSR